LRQQTQALCQREIADFIHRDGISAGPARPVPYVAPARREARVAGEAHERKDYFLSLAGDSEARNALISRA
jgi:hypothetical protein